MAGPTPGSAPATNTQVGAAAYAVAKTCLGVPYAWGGNNPPPAGPGLDCSGLMVYAYNTGPGAPGVSLGGRTVAQFWNNSTTLIRVVDCTAADKGITADALTQKLAVGDLLIFGPPGFADPSAGHVIMYAGGGQTIEEPHTGAVCFQGPMYAPGGASSSDPFLGAMRPAVEGNASAGASGGSGGGSSTQGSGTQSTTGATWQKEVQTQQAIIAKLPDPRDNLPFSKYFQMMNVPPGNKLVRGGIADLTTKQFRLYFMMNPQQISMGSNIDTTNLTSPLQQDPTNMQYGGYWVTNQTISFTVYFNRMYEVWEGGVKGPSDIGCRWDIRALERLVGIFDASTKGGANVGVGNYGAGGYPPMTYPLQVVFGGANSYSFQGTIASLDYTYTLFDHNMIPIEAYADISVMRIYQPAMSSPDLVNSLPLTASTGGQYLSSVKATQSTAGSTAQFNLKKGTGS
jgi:cell wall-associated NlpC family hydrolase